jgi:5'-nucleotidase
MHILITNDDGVHAPGLLALAQAIQPLGKITVVAPDRNWSMCGHVKTIFKPLNIQKVQLAEDITALAVSGAPSDCVAISLMGMLAEKVDLVVSGINPYPNLGHDLTYSGTVTAAMEATINGLPAVAVSLAGPDHHHDPADVDYSTAAAVAASVVRQVIRNGLPADTLLNVNVPYLSLAKLRGYRITRQGKRIYLDKLLPPQAGQTEYQIGGDPPHGEIEEGTDFGALAEGCVSIMPVHLDLTAYHFMQTLREWDWDNGAV